MNLKSPDGVIRYSNFSENNLSIVFTVECMKFLEHHYESYIKMRSVDSFYLKSLLGICLNNA